MTLAVNNRELQTDYSSPSYCEIPQQTSQEGCISAPLFYIPIGAKIYGIYKLPVFQSSETAILLGHEGDLVKIQFPKGDIRYFKNNLIATVKDYRIDQLKGLNQERFSLISEAMSKIPWKKIVKIGAALIGIAVAFALVNDLSKIKRNKLPEDGNLITSNGLSETYTEPFETIEEVQHFLFDETNEETQYIPNTIKMEPNEPKEEVQPIPCTIKMAPYELDIDGNCTKEERKKAWEDYNQLMKTHDEEVKREARKEADEYLRKLDEKFAPILQEAEEYKKEIREKERRRNHPTPEEIEEDERNIVESIRKEYPHMEEYLRARYPKYFEVLPPPPEACDEACQQNARRILGVSLTADCNEIKKQYHKLSLKFHPDKNQNEEVYYLKIAEAYQRLCR
jgi:DnaJ domain